MSNDILHTFHIPVMGLGHSADTPIRVAPFGINSVISIMEDRMLEALRGYYCGLYDSPYEKIEDHEPDARSRRITAYLNLVKEIVHLRMETIRRRPFFEANDKQKYFEMLPESSPLKKDWRRLLDMTEGEERTALEEDLSRRMTPGSIDVNIMVKVDNPRFDSDGNSLGEDASDARTALRGYAESDLESAIVFSAGINKSLFTYLTKLEDFYRDEAGNIRKKIVVKVSDFRSALLQGRFLAKKGLEVHEYRIESGLNCGGHAFATQGVILPAAVREFADKRHQLSAGLMKDVRKWYADRERPFPEAVQPPLVTVQGGIGTSGEARRLQERFGMDMTGWATPFLLVPEATPVDEPTRKLLAMAGARDLYLSGASPFGIPFNNIRRSPSEVATRKRAAMGKAGAPCTRRLLAFNTEFTERNICTASRRYQREKLGELGRLRLSDEEREQRRREITEKVCLCEHLGNGALIALGLEKDEDAPSCVCPGPNIEWFSRYYSLREMVDHIYGRGESLISAARPHMFAKEIMLYADYFEKMAEKSEGAPRDVKSLSAFKKNLEAGIAYCLEIAGETPYPGENLESLAVCAEEQKKRLNSVFNLFKKKLADDPETEISAAEMEVA